MVQTFTSKKQVNTPRKEGTPCVSSISPEELEQRYAAIDWSDYKRADDGAEKADSKWKKVYGPRKDSSVS